MTNLELFSNIEIKQDDSEVKYFYDPTGTKRWRIHQFVMEWENKQHRSLSLEGKTYKGTWHTLMEAYQGRSVETGEELEAGISVTTMNGDTHLADTTPAIDTFYSTQRDGLGTLGAQTGYYGKAEQIAKDLKEMNALALTPDQLPKRIDVYSTVSRLADNFRMGVFEPPSFVIPNSNNSKTAHRITAKIFPFLSRLKSGE